MLSCYLCHLVLNSYKGKSKCYFGQSSEFQMWRDERQRDGLWCGNSPQDKMEASLDSTLSRFALIEPDWTGASQSAEPRLRPWLTTDKLRCIAVNRGRCCAWEWWIGHYGPTLGGRGILILLVGKYSKCKIEKRTLSLVSQFVWCCNKFLYKWAL